MKMPRVKQAATRKSSRRVGGESSSRRATLEFDKLRFSTKEKELWYRERSSNKFVVEKTISLEIDREFILKELFRTLGWARVMELRGAYYPELVRQFYANLWRNENNPPRLQSMVKE